MDFSDRILGWFLFNGIEGDDLKKCFSKCAFDTREYKKDDVIYSPSEFEKKLGFVISGECRVQRLRPSGGAIPLNVLTSGDSFGILAVFTGRDEFPTHIVARRDTKIVYISKPELIEMTAISPQISLNIISFLANRIDFLCDKVSSFSSDNVEQKLAQYLLRLYNQTASAELKFNKKQAAESLNTGRTSLYRSLEKLEESGLIKIVDKKIIILDPEGLERITK